MPLSEVTKGSVPFVAIIQFVNICRTKTIEIIFCYVIMKIQIKRKEVKIWNKN